MAVKFLKRNIFQRILGLSATPKPSTADCWQFSGDKVIVDLDNAPELNTGGGALRLEGGRLPVRVLVLKGDDGEYSAYRNRCTHFGHRRLDPVPGTDTVQCCSLNKSTYDQEGHKIYGPAPHPITRYPVAVSGSQLFIKIR